ncbi:MAG: leucine--tRNA ligase [Clostridia bacterium]|nr:leucine--tRNA ligase [Clostridia bacterium]
MNMLEIEKKWQKIWDETKLNEFDGNTDKKYYCLEMFSYPSGSNLHIGHWYNYGLSDSFARYKRMKGYSVFQPMGFDAFGLPAENYAIKTGIHPEDSTIKNIATMEGQLRRMGGMFDWTKEIKTCMPDYYKWTQWVFLKLFEKGLAYRKEAPVNWCPSCSTVLANEQVIGGECERCGSQVIKKNLTQWFLKITDYAEELLTCIDKLDWPEKTKLMQKNWIGKSVGAEVVFKTESNKEFKVFTTRIDTIFGVSYVVLAPEHPLVKEITTAEQRAAVEDYAMQTAKANEIERLSSDREKTGVFTGAYAINPANGKKVPIWVADYVLYSYGTGAVMGVPAHDERDFGFAKKYNHPVNQVISDGNENTALPYTEDGVLVNCGEFDGLRGEKARLAIIDKLAENGLACKKVNYRLRDWLVSRQRYWGAPIPIIHCPHCGDVAVPYEDLPVKLPYDVEFKPDGKSPLAKHDGFMHTTCPKCGKPALRDSDTLDTFVCSSWYFLRYADANNAEKAFDTEIINKMLPVDKYIGGAEHACMHLLYARFITKALRDMGYLNFDEPFTSLVHQGVILGPDGNKMSKSKGNVVMPDVYVNEYGSDIFRLYLLFGFNYTEGGPWSDDGIKSVAKFLDRVERLFDKTLTLNDDGARVLGEAEKEVEFVLHNTIKAVDRDMDVFSFNTAIARLMECVNALTKYEALPTKNNKLLKDSINVLIKLLAPCVPHFAEELWSKLGNTSSVFKEQYPVYDPAKTVKDQIEYAVQVNSKLKTRLVLSKSLNKAEIEQAVLNDANVLSILDGAQIKKVIVIPERLVNIIV